MGWADRAETVEMAETVVSVPAGRADKGKAAWVPGERAALAVPAGKADRVETAAWAKAGRVERAAAAWGGNWVDMDTAFAANPPSNPHRAVRSNRGGNRNLLCGSRRVSLLRTRDHSTKNYCLASA
ncbi:MAG: hypothetical protein LBS96_06475 [Oscillospiraceae bacterium]|nr:hypothetical protein [Oscillospiraceae bacterium]